MKNIIFILLILVVSAKVNAQLKNTKWSGTIQGDNAIEVVFNFKTDTIDVLNKMDNSVLETLTYAVKDSVVTLQKVYGQSSCDDTNAGLYKIEIKENVLFFKLISDACNDRTVALDNSKWMKIE